MPSRGDGLRGGSADPSGRAGGGPGGPYSLTEVREEPVEKRPEKKLAVRRSVPDSSHSLSAGIPRDGSHSFPSEQCAVAHTNGTPEDRRIFQWVQAGSPSGVLWARPSFLTTANPS